MKALRTSVFWIFMVFVSVTATVTLYAEEAQIPHITTGFSDWVDTLAGDNNSAFDQTFTLTLFADGIPVYQGQHTIKALGSLNLDLKSLSPAAENGQITYTSSSLQFRLGYENSGGGIAEFPLSNKLCSTLGLYFSDYASSITYKGAAMSNIGAETINVTLYAVGAQSGDEAGAVLESAVISMAPYERIFGLHTDWFPDVAFSQIKKIIAVSDKASLSGLTICGNNANSNLLFTSGLEVYGFDIRRVNVVNDIYYKEGSTLAKQALDIYYPEGASGSRVLIFVPGGAWRQGDKSMYSELGNLFAGYYGCVVAAVNYRLSNDDDGSAVHPDHLEDLASAFAWIKKNIESYNGSATDIFLFGQSAGAHLVALLSTDEQYLAAESCSLSDIKGAISMSGAYDLYDLAAYPSNPSGLTADEVLVYKAIFYSAFGSWEETVLDAASPATHINLNQPPFLVIDTDVDMPGFTAQAQSFVDSITGIGAEVEYKHLYRSDYSANTWQTATDLAAEEPAFEDYIGHYAEMVAINENDRNTVPTTWIINFMNAH